MAKFYAEMRAPDRRQKKSLASDAEITVIFAPSNNQRHEVTVSAEGIKVWTVNKEGEHFWQRGN